MTGKPTIAGLAATLTLLAAVSAAQADTTLEF